MIIFGFSKFFLVGNWKKKHINNITSNLNNPHTKSKTYWSILKTFYNGKRIPLIPSLLKSNKRVKL